MITVFNQFHHLILIANFCWNAKEIIFFSSLKWILKFVVLHTDISIYNGVRKIWRILSNNKVCMKQIKSFVSKLKLFKLFPGQKNNTAKYRKIYHNLPKFKKTNIRCQLECVILFSYLEIDNQWKIQPKNWNGGILQEKWKKKIDGINLIIVVNSSNGRLRRLNKEYIALNSITTKSNIDLSPSFNKLH